MLPSAKSLSCYVVGVLLVAGLGLASLGSALQADVMAPERATRSAKDGQVVSLENLTWVEVSDRIKAGTRLIIIPTGGTEQNGPHMVLGKHNYIVAETSARIARRLGNSLVAPVMAYVPEGDAGRKTGHMAFPGTISLSEGVFESVLAQAALSFKTHGFTTIVLLGDSGGNQAAQARVAARLNAQWQGEGVRVIHAGDYYAKNGGYAFLLKKGETAETIGSHAGIRDTSELMAAYVQGVDLTNAAANSFGALGDARRATLALGEQLLEGKVEAAVAQIRAEMSSDGDGESDRVKDGKSPGLFTWLLRAIFG